MRTKRRLRQEDVAARAGVSRGVISKIERGQFGNVQVQAVMAVAAGLGIRVEWRVSMLGADLDRLLNARHARMHEAMARLLAHLPGWAFAPEVSYSEYGERGVIDILAWHAGTRSLLVIELKTDIVDVSELMGKVDQKRRLARKVAMSRGWDALDVAVWVVVADSSTNRRRVNRHSATLRAAFPLDGRQMPAWLRHPKGSAAALSMLSAPSTGSTRHDLATVRRVRTASARAA